MPHRRLSTGRSGGGRRSDLRTGNRVVGCPARERVGATSPKPRAPTRIRCTETQNQALGHSVDVQTRSIASRSCLEWLLLLWPGGGGAESLAGGGRFSGGEVSAGQAHRYRGEAGRTLPSWTSPRACHHHHLRTACSQRQPAAPALCRLSASLGFTHRAAQEG